MAAALPSRAWRGGWRDGLSYGSLGLPLAFVALPLYVLLPNHYASVYGVPLALLGVVLLGARLLDAFADPLIGRWADALLGGSAPRAWRVLAAAACVLALGFRALFFPPVEGTTALLWWCAVGLAATYLGFSVVSVIHQAWGARLGGDEVQRARIVAWREGLALAGVLVASVLPSLAGLNATTLAFTALLAIGVLSLAWAPRRAPGQDQSSAPAAPTGIPSGRALRNSPLGRPGGLTEVPSGCALRNSPLGRPGGLMLPWTTPAFRRLLAIYLCNGIASAIPATLVLFFIRDRLQAAAFEPLFLAAYFAAGALSIPFWLRLVARHGLARTWLAAMGLAVLTFGWASQLGAGDVVAFAVVCLASGVALGADLTLPGALLAGVIQRAGHAQRAEGSYMGWWNFATKLNLALAAGLALPALQALGYAPGARDAAALSALTAAYCLLPCALKLAAAALLYCTWNSAEEGHP